MPRSHLDAGPLSRLPSAKNDDDFIFMVIRRDSKGKTYTLCSRPVGGPQVRHILAAAVKEAAPTPSSCCINKGRTRR